MRKPVTLVIGLLILVCSVHAQEIALEHEKPIRPAKGLRPWGGQGAWAARITPDQKHLLYARRIAPTDPNISDRRYELVVHNLETGRERIIPLSPLPSGYESVFIRYNFFNPDGGTMALFKMLDPAADKPPQMRIVLYDLAQNKLRETEVTGNRVLARFDRTGKKLIITEGISVFVAPLDDLNSRKNSAIRGWVHSVSLASDRLTVFVPPDPRQPRQARRMHLQLWDISADKQIAELPTHERNNSLDDFEAQWTADGQYVYYLDFDNDPATANRLTSVTRIWDARENKLAGAVADAQPVGHGPTPSGMFLAREQAGALDIVFHDAASGRSLIIPGPIKLSHAQGSKLAFIKAVGGQEMLCIADVVLRK